MSKIVCVLPIIFLAIALVGAYNNGVYGRRRREIPAQQAQPQQQAAAQQGQPGQQAQFQPVRGPKMFSVNVADGIKGANQLRKEKWDNGTVTGLYANPLGNKKYQIINYIADDKGYRVLSTKVVDESELAMLGGDGKFSPQSGKSAQVDITNDGATTSYTVTPDQMAQQKTQPQGRSTKDSSSKSDSSKDSKDNTSDDKDQDTDKKMGKRSIEMDMDKDGDKDMDAAHMGKRSAPYGYGGNSGYGGGYSGYGAPYMNDGGYGYSG